MKKILILFILFVITFLFYLRYNSRAYHLGISCCFYLNDLPFNLKPVFDDSQIDINYQFNISDVNGYPVIGAGFKYRNSDIKIKRIIEYGYDNNHFIIKVIDDKNIETFFIASAEKINKDVFFFKEIKYENINKLNIKLKWINIDSNEQYNVRFIRNGLFILLIIQVFLIIKSVMGTN